MNYEKYTKDGISHRVVRINYADLIAETSAPFESDVCREGNNSSRDAQPRESWDLGVGLSGALELAQRGWQDFSSEFSDLAKSLQPQGDRTDIRYQMSNAGDSVDVQAYLAGDPDCFLEPVIEVSRGDSPIVEILMNASASCCVSAESIRRRGAAVYALCEALERAGKAVGVTVLVAQDSPKGHMIHTFMCTKEPHEHSHAPRLAFALAHPAFMRRIWFRLAERLPREARAEFLMGVNGGGYGYPRNCHESLLPTGNVINFDSSIYGDDSTFSSPELTRRFIRQKLQEQGVMVQS